MDPDHGWTMACPASAASLTVVDDDDPDLVTCRQCANSGLTPSRWLTSTPDEAAR